MKKTAITISMINQQGMNRTEGQSLCAVDGEQRMTSMEIAELTGKQHKDVLKAIRNMEPAWLKVNGRKFALVEYQAMATMECGLTVKQQEKLVPIIAHSWAMK